MRTVLGFFSAPSSIRATRVRMSLYRSSLHWRTRLLVRSSTPTASVTGTGLPRASSGRFWLAWAAASALDEQREGLVVGLSDWLVCSRTTSLLTRRAPAAQAHWIR